ncbi:MAG: hypothetical protein J6A46_00695 [Clostridia bacterium]|nr:hypothetical protein [Clostridia bacterium]
MKKRFKFSLIGSLLGIAALFCAAGCSLNKTDAQIKEDYNLNASVTYYANGGDFGKESKTEVQLWMDASKEAYPFNMPSNNATLNSESDHKFGKGTLKIDRKNYVFQGWYYLVVDETTGEPVYDENGNLQLGEPVDFSKPLSVNEHLHLVASWLKRELVEIRLVSPIEFTATVEQTKNGETVKDETGAIVMESRTVKTGDVLRLEEYETTTKTVTLSPTSSPTQDETEATFFAYYADEACTQPLTGDALTLKPLGLGTNQIVYAKYIEGDWEIIRSKKDYSVIFSSRNARGNYYLTTDLDLTGEEITPLTSFAGTLQGNGHVIKGLTVNAPAGAVAENSKLAAFGTVKATAKFLNVTFENFSVNIDTNPNRVKHLTAFMLWTQAEDGATFENVTIKGGSLSVAKGEATEIFNAFGEWIEDAAHDDGGYWTWEENNYLFGGEESDDAFLAKYTGIAVVEKPTLQITNK